MRGLAVVSLFLAGCGGGGTGTDSGVDLTGLPDHCSNGKQDSDETDLDCGGSCPVCALGKMCLRGGDCAGGSCVNNVCVAAPGDAAMGGDAAAPPDFAMPQDLTVPGCANNQQCTGLAHATGTCDQSGKCAVASCDPGFADCDKAAANGCEAATDTDPANCGMCGTSCAMVVNGSGACMAGKCAIAGCNAGYANCDGLFASGCATATSTDIQNCGACGHLCAAANATPGCTNGKCGIMACNQGYADCDVNPDTGCEAALTSDPMNCGKCGNKCPMNAPACSNSACGAEDFPPIYLLYLLESN